MIKALFFDIDGTLVSFRTHTIPHSTIQALEAAKADGVRLFIATGRPTVIINNLHPLQERGLIDGYVTMNGSYCFVGSEVIYKHAIPAAEVQTIMGYCDRRNIACIVVGEHDIGVCHPDHVVQEIFYEHLKVDELPIETPAQALQRPEIFQLTPFINASEEEELLPSIPHCEIGRWHPAFVDITAQGTTKQQGINAILKHFGWQREEVMAFGDGGNDIPMLRYAGIGVAMGNALDAVKESADYVTASVDEDGIAHALEHFNLISPLPNS